jgi:hyperosmotically inducible periplasmic protein
MTKTSVISVNTGKTLRALALVACLGALPLMVGVTGCASDRYNQSSSQRIDDNRTADRVKDALAHDPEYKYDGINVAVFKGVVQLSGFVNTRAQKSSAGDLARKVQGVRELENNITVKDMISKS